MLTSRKIKREDFVKEFLGTIKPGIIKRNEFINWEKITKKHNSYSKEIEFFSELSSKDEADKLGYLRDSLLASDEPYKLVKICFELLAHTQDRYVSWEDDLSIKEIAQGIKEGHENKSEEFVSLLRDLGFQNVLKIEKIEDYFTGVLVGLETHRRKNTGGKAYVDHVRDLLKKIVSNLEKEKYLVSLIEEERIIYEGSTQSKKVDFAIKLNEKVIIGIEVNFYTNTGSKPTEIKRSYGEVNRKLNERGIELVWITDGFGYNIMKRSLGDAFEIHPNIYNTYMLENSLEEDIRNLLNSKIKS